MKVEIINKIVKKIKIFRYNIKNHNIPYAINSFIHRKNYKYYKKNFNRLDFKNEIEELYFKRKNKILDLENPKSFNEKIQNLKYYDNIKSKTELADKYLMKKYITKEIGEEYNVKCLGNWKKFEEINFDKLPEQFVLKCNHGSGMNWIVKDKNKINKIELKKKIKKALNTDFSIVNGFELQYHNIDRLIFAEEFIKDEFADLQVWIANEKILFMCYIKDPHGDNRKKSYDENWNELDFVTSKPKLEDKIKKPKNLDEIKKLSIKLAKGFKFVRVDWYLINNDKIKISELTFTPASGFCEWDPSDADNRFKEFYVK